MKKLSKLMVLIVACGLFVGFQIVSTQAATKKVTVTVKYVHSKSGKTISSKKYQLKVGEKKKVNYSLFTGYLKKNGHFTIKAGNKNATKTIKMSPTKYRYYTVKYKNERTGETLYSYDYKMYPGKSRSVYYQTFTGYESKWYSSESFTLKQPKKNTTKTFYLKPEEVNVYVADVDKYGNCLYNNSGTKVEETRFIGKRFFGDTITIKPLSGYNGYAMPSNKKVKINKTYYSPYTIDDALKITYPNKKEQVTWRVKDSYSGIQLGTFKRMQEFGVSEQVTIILDKNGANEKWDTYSNWIWNKYPSSQEGYWSVYWDLEYRGYYPSITLMN